MAKPFTVDALLSMPRVDALTVSSDGSRLVTSVARPDADGKRFATSWWELDPTGQRPPRRLTRSAPGPTAAAFLPDGSLLFLSARDEPDAAGDGPTDQAAALWLLPPAPGEPRLVAAPPGGADGLAVAREAGTVVLAARTHPATGAWSEDADRERARKDAGVAAQLFETYPIRFWDHWLGPRQRRLYAVERPDPDAGDDPTEPADLTPDPARALDEVSFAVTPDGSTVVTAWWRPAADPRQRVADLVAIDVATGRRRTLVADGANYGQVTCSPDGRRAVCVRTELGDPDTPPDRTLWLVELAGDEQRDLAADLDRWPAEPVWTPDSAAVLFVADDGGHRLPFRVDLDSGTVIRLADEGAFGCLCPAPDGAAIYALRHGVATAPHVVALDPAGVDRRPRPLPSPGDDVAGPWARAAPQAPPEGGDPNAARAAPQAPPEGGDPNPARAAPQAPPEGGDPNAARAAGGDPNRAQPAGGLQLGRVERVHATAADGTEIGAWLVLPPEASPEAPAPLALFVHGGPLMSWNGWHWRWNPHVLASRGYAVLLPDPAESTGYGRAFIARGWGRWGEPHHADLMAAVDVAVTRADIDPDRTAALGASFGGYMANWIAGHTDRFRAIVTHASLWTLRAFHGTTDLGVLWERELGDPYADRSRYEASSPDAHVGRIRTPMLVIHGERDYRVPISEALALWTDLCRNGVAAKFLYFPDEHHWIVKPQNARLWYETVLAFLDHHLRDQPWSPPTLL